VGKRFVAVKNYYLRTDRYCTYSFHSL